MEEINYSPYQSNSHMSDHLLLRLNEKRYKHLLIKHGEMKGSLNNYQKDKYFKQYLSNQYYRPENSIMEGFNNNQKNYDTLYNQQQNMKNTGDEISSLQKDINDKQLDINYYKFMNFIIIGVIVFIGSMLIMPSFGLAATFLFVFFPMLFIFLFELFDIFFII